MMKTFFHSAPALVLACACLVSGVSATTAVAQSTPPNFSEEKFAALLIDAVSGEVLSGQAAERVRHPASLTKLMTLYIAFDEVTAGRLRFDDRITVSSRAAQQPPSKMGVPAGQTLSVDEALHAVAIKSANDVAVALAEHLAGSESAFAERMNRQARELGMTSTHFRNASGLPNPQQVTTAGDMAILARATLRDHPQHYAIFRRPSFEFGGKTIWSHNRVTHRLRGADGLKTGYIKASGFNLVTSASRDGRRLIGVVMGGASAAARDAYMEDLFANGFSALSRRMAGESITSAQMLPRTLSIAAQPEPKEQGSAD